MRTEMIWVTLVLSQLAACSAMRYERVKLDSPTPAGLCQWDPNRKFFKIAKNQSCAVPIPADHTLTRTGIAVQTDEVYTFDPMPTQVWYDADRRLAALKGEEGSALMRMANYWKKRKKQPYFSLIAVVIGPDGAESPNWVSLGDTEAPKIGNTIVLKVSEPGELGLYPNDARGFYGNNKGLLWVRVTNCGPQCTAVLQTMGAAQTTGALGGTTGGN